MKKVLFFISLIVLGEGLQYLFGTIGLYSLYISLIIGFEVICVKALKNILSQAKEDVMEN